MLNPMSMIPARAMANTGPSPKVVTEKTRIKLRGPCTLLKIRPVIANVPIAEIISPRRRRVSIFIRPAIRRVNRLEVIKEAFSQAEQTVNGVELSELECSIEINGKGQIGILGTGGEAGAKGAIKLKFTKKDD